MRRASYGHWNLCRWKNTSALVRVTISSTSGDSLASLIDQPFLEQAPKEVAAAGYIPTHEEVRGMTAKDASSWSEAIIKARDDRF